MLKAKLPLLGCRLHRSPLSAPATLASLPNHSRPSISPPFFSSLLPSITSQCHRCIVMYCMHIWALCTKTVIFLPSYEPIFTPLMVISTCQNTCSSCDYTEGFNQLLNSMDLNHVCESNQISSSWWVHMHNKPLSWKRSLTSPERHEAKRSREET